MVIIHMPQGNSSTNYGKRTKGNEQLVSKYRLALAGVETLSSAYWACMQPTGLTQEDKLNLLPSISQATQINNIVLLIAGEDKSSPLPSVDEENK